MATKIFFANAPLPRYFRGQKLLQSTLFRMIYLSKPNAGLSLLTRQLFSGRVKLSISTALVLTLEADHILLQ